MGAGRETLRTVCPDSLLITRLVISGWHCCPAQVIMSGFNTSGFPLCLFVFFQSVKISLTVSDSHMFSTGESNITWDNAESLEKAGHRSTPADKTMRQFNCWAVSTLQSFKCESSSRFECRSQTEELRRLQSQGAKQARGLCLGGEVIISVQIRLLYINKLVTNCYIYCPCILWWPCQIIKLCMTGL